MTPGSDQQPIVPFRLFPTEKKHLRRGVNSKSRGKNALFQPVHQWKTQEVNHHYCCINILQQFINGISGAC